MKNMLPAAVLACAVLTGCGERDAPWIFGNGGEGRDVYLYGGAFTSSPLALVYGYGDDWEGCQNLVKGHQLLFPGSQQHYFCSYEARRQ